MQVKAEVNKCYRLLEIDVDNVFSSLSTSALLLVNTLPGGIFHIAVAIQLLANKMSATNRPVCGLQRDLDILCSLVEDCILPLHKTVQITQVARK